MNAVTVRYGYPLLMASNYASIWILSLICAQRYQSVCHPWNVWKHRLAPVKNSKFCIFIVVLLAVGKQRKKTFANSDIFKFFSALNVIRFWELETFEGYVRVTPLRYDLLYKIIQEGIIYGCVVYGFPMLLLLWFNYNTFKLIRVDEVYIFFFKYLTFFKCRIIIAPSMSTIRRAPNCNDDRMRVYLFLFVHNHGSLNSTCNVSLSIVDRTQF